MAIKKSDLYSSLWASCDALRGGMDASQYKDYVLVLLFLKYVSDKYAGQPYAPITIPPGASFADMVALKGTPDIGDQINKKIVGPLAAANKLADMPDFNDATKLGTGKEMVERLSNLIATFQNPALDFSKNRADGDDILGDAYEYLIGQFAAGSGKKAGEFYTPQQMSTILSRLVVLDAHDPTTLNRQGADRGTQYRSIIIAQTPAQRVAAETAKASAQARFRDPIVTEIIDTTEFFPAESYHQDFTARNPNHPYVQSVIALKLEKLKSKSGE
jgi:hypothetical protein